MDKLDALSKPEELLEGRGKCKWGGGEGEGGGGGEVLTLFFECSFAEIPLPTRTLWGGKFSLEEHFTDGQLLLCYCQRPLERALL